MSLASLGESDEREWLALEMQLRVIEIKSWNDMGILWKEVGGAFDGTVELIKQIPFVFKAYRTGYKVQVPSRCVRARINISLLSAIVRWGKLFAESISNQKAKRNRLSIGVIDRSSASVDSESERVPALEEPSNFSLSQSQWLVLLLPGVELSLVSEKCGLALDVSLQDLHLAFGVPFVFKLRSLSVRLNKLAGMLSIELSLFFFLSQNIQRC
jgi:hypothetical protein